MNISGFKGLQHWPVPDEHARAQSERLTTLILSEIDANDGQIGFDRYMEMALYQPGLGYYSAGARKFGQDGDFTTAPETSPLFSICLARQCEQVFSQTGAATVLELGAGTGIMACDILTELKQRHAIPDHYLILETSADLRERQQQVLQQRHADIFERLVWLDTLPDNAIDGIILANEVLDALPAHRLHIHHGVVCELRVGRMENSFEWQTSADAFLPEQMQHILGGYLGELPDGYITDFNAILQPFIQALSSTLGTGAIILVDYGYPRREYYHPQRAAGTLVCHYRHRRHDNPFIYPGIQDITTSVDFTLVAEAAHASGLEIHEFTTQAGFLVYCGLEKIIADISMGDDKRLLRLTQQAGRLILPGEMGETFKVMMLGRNLRPPLPGSGFGSQLHRL